MRIRLVSAPGSLLLPQLGGMHELCRLGLGQSGPRRHGVDDGGGVLDRWAFPHTEAGWQMAVGRLRGHGEPGDLPVIIEKTSGLIVDRILAAGHPVVPVHPDSFYAARPRWGASGAKSDPGDSCKLADYLRTDGHRLRRIEPADAGLRELQALVRLREDQVRARTAADCQLWAMLGNYWPARATCSTRWPRRSRWHSSPTTPRRKLPPGSARPAWPRSCAAAPTAAARARPCC
jgi:hypothetical protein